MTKKELKQFLMHYWQYYRALENGEASTEILIYGRQKRIVFPEWGYAVANYIRRFITKARGKSVGKMLKLYFYEGKTDKEVMNRIPVSESTYYRWKYKLIDMLYSFLIYDGYVGKEEILRSYEEGAGQ